MENHSLKRMSDTQLRARLKSLAKDERAQCAALLRHLGEYDARKLYVQDRLYSLWKYCAVVLKFPEPEIAKRIQAARASRDCPELLDMLERGETSLSNIAQLSPHLKSENRKALVEAARGKTYREVQFLAATEREKERRKQLGVEALLDPQESLFGGERREPVFVPDPAQYRDKIVPLSSTHAKVEFVATKELVQKYEKAQALLARKFPSGRLSEILDAALDRLLEQEDPSRRHARRMARRERLKRRLGADGSRRVAARQLGTDSAAAPARAAATPLRTAITRELRDAVLVRDGHRCTAREDGGTRCTETKYLEIDHVEPLALGGKTELGNLRARCRRHNHASAREVFGDKRVDAGIAASRLKSAKRNGTNGIRSPSD